MNKLEKDDIIQKLIEKGVNSPCPRCSNDAFTLVDGYFNQTIQDSVSGFLVGGTGIPSIVTACTNCGFLSQYALGALGLLPDQLWK
ncbi:MAG: hypothetical protein MK009_07300 [Gammaproteobacteria bacterium]|jgi:hypothetical protein|nr:hypothetical protein [Gammaproteobacteria bacterium]MCH2669638.1 hypothetical protein [Gammaproteobacteria bacterium]|tara:strand:- start:1296 stop:1553 length:258 start_codon:yes stop_codon:yes gene_type:complete